MSANARHKNANHKAVPKSGAVAALMMCLFGLFPLPASASLPEGLPTLPQTGERMLINRISGIALSGYDAVAYHVLGRPVAGSQTHEFVWSGVTWRFSSQANKAAFMADPEGFAPLFEGYDPYGVAKSRAVASDPYLFTLHRGQLVMFHSPESQKRFLDNVTVLGTATKAWPDVAKLLAH